MYSVGSFVKPIKLAAFLAAALVLAGSQHLLGAGANDDVIAGPVEAQVLRVVDGDTIVVRARIWLDQDIRTGVRLLGVDTPELNGKCEKESRLARKARDFVRDKLEGQTVHLHDIDYDKYARRVVARVRFSESEYLSEVLLKAGLGHPYGGGKRASWCLD